MSSRDFWLIIVFLLVSCLSVKGQVEKAYGRSDDTSLPEWVQMMYGEAPDIGKVLSAYEAYYSDHPFKKNSHTQYFKRWLRETSTYNYQFHDPTLSESERSQLRAQEKAYLQRSTDVTNQRQAMTANWSCIGPFDWDHDAASRGYAPGAAHIYTVEHCASSPNVLYAGTATAGVWKSTDHGLNWTNVTKDLLVEQVYAIEVDHTDPDIAYASLFNSIYKTTDGGSNWLPTGDFSFRFQSLATKDIRMHPTNQDIVFAATDNGFYKTTDGGATWTQELTGSFLELEFHPTNPNTIYAVKQIDNRTEFYKSTNGGSDFSLQTNGWPVPNINDPDDENMRTEIAVTPANPSKVYALLTGKVNGGSGLYGVYVSTDEGASWSFTCCGPQPGGMPDLWTFPQNINTMGWSKWGDDDGGQYYYDLAFDVSPTNEDSVFMGGINLWVSGDGGASFICPAKWSEPELSGYVHADLHDLHYYPNGEIWIACDGGIFYSTDGGVTFTRRMFGIAGSDFWGFGASFWNDGVMLGGAYHNGTLIKNENTYLNDWLCTDGGDGVGGFVNVGNEKTVYGQNDIKTLSDDRTVNISTRAYDLKPYISSVQGRSSQIEFHPNYYNHYYFGREDGLWKTEDDNHTTFLIHDFGEQVADVEISWADTNVIYVTTWPGFWDDKKVYRTTDGGQNWTDITPSTSIVSSSRFIEYDIEPSYTDPNTLWLARVGRQSNLRDKVFKSTDGGASWTNITSPTLDGEVLTNIVLQRGTDEGLYLGTTRSVYYRNNSLGEWQLFNNGLPLTTRSRRLFINYRTESIINGTNRSVWLSNLYETAAPEVELAVDQKFKGCARDTFYFVDHSALSETGSSWNWSFPGAAYVSSTTSRTPKVVYGTPGTYDVSLTVADVHGSSSKTINGMVRAGTECSPSSLPVDLLSFDARLLPSKNVQLDWQTANELNNEGFEIERSLDGREWIAIGYVEGQGTSSNTERYRYIDPTPQTGINYYRLRQIDYNGQHAYSAIRSVSVGDLAIRVYPNPIGEEAELHVNFTTAPSQEASTLRIFDVSGKVVQQLRLSGQNNQVSVGNLSTGVYFVEIVNGRRIFKKRLIVW